MSIFDSDEYASNWLNKRFPPEQMMRRRNHQWWANLRQVLFIMAILSFLVLSYIFNFILFGSNIDPLWVLLGVLPGVMALLGALVIAGMFVQTVFGLATWWDGFRYALLCLFGRPWPLKYPFAIISEGKVRDSDRRKFLANRQLGGPGKLFVHNDNAVVLERFGHISRIEGPGAVFLDRFERIREILDLRPQVRTVPAARVYTNDGIAVETEITVRFQIRCGVPCLEKPYPALETALGHVARAEARRSLGSASPTKMDWRARVMGNVDSTLRDIVAGKSFDQLFEPGDVNRDPRDEIGREMLERLRQQVNSLGVHILDVMLGPFKPADPGIEQQRRAAWQALQNAENRVEEATGQAQLMLARETAYAYAQLEMMLAIDRGFQKFVGRDQDLRPHFVALQFIETIRHIAFSPGVGPLLPLETIKSLEFLNNKLLGSPAREPLTSAPPNPSNPARNPNDSDRERG